MNLQLKGIEHRTNPVKRPQSNGFVERLHRTLLYEHFSIRGRHMTCRTPIKALIDGLPAKEKQAEIENKKAA